MTIQVLSSDLINKIAAGEVIERPASVVKELVENAIDAKSSQISIEIQDAGKKLIRVSDDGVGMSKDEIKLAVERHSTSKITKLDDLFNINTLGFRGEALPSICSVAKVEIQSKAKGEIGEPCHGMAIQIEGGKTKKHEDVGCPEGTSISIKDLFYNVPARKKFLKSNYVEMGHISSLIGKFILSNPQIKFKLISDGKPIYQSSGKGELLDSIASVYGAEIAKQLLKVDSPNVIGYVSKPNISRVDRTYESFFVNGRYIRNALVSSALESCYRTLIPIGRHPIAVLFIKINPAEVDVNVHPAKREVKFLKTREVLDSVSGAVKKTLSSIEIKSENAGFSPFSSEAQWDPQMENLLFDGQQQLQNMTEVEIAVTEVQPLIPIYQYKNTYIVATDGDSLVLIDQHAAHERILFDRLETRTQTQETSQALLVPETLEFSHSEALILEENLEYIISLGFELEVFGKDSFILRAVPSILGKGSARALLEDLELGKEKAREKVWKLIACHGAIKAGDKLETEEINQLIRDLYKTANPLTCPHGRPTMIRFQEKDLEKLFGRI
ncbi:MAG: DNA mismatch repair endonuclease MutL [Candidatus Saganbacteria bacterium]|nr:DNA mismatch repair endonuclease MutL [Candidatus Saganbacteria bacterium]